MRDYGPSRAKPILAGFQQFDQALKPFATAMKIQFRPMINSAGKSPARLSGQRGHSWRARVNIVHTLWMDSAGAVADKA